MKNYLGLIIFLFLSLLLSNCKTEKGPISTQTEYDTLLTKYTTMFGDRANLQSVSEVMIQSGIAYNANLTLDTIVKKGYYKTTQTAASLCGVFSADALYHSAFGKSDNAFESYTSAQVLANYIGIGPFYVEYLLRRNESGLSENDSMLFKFDEVLAFNDTVLTDNDRFRAISSYLLGNLIEKLYLINKGVATLEEKPVIEITKEAQFLFELLIISENAIDLFVDIINKYSVEPDNQLNIEVKSLQALYKQFSEVGIPNYMPGDKYLPSEEMKNISAQVELIRNLIIEIEE